MTGPEHYQAAERLLDGVAETSADDGEAAVTVALAQVHATLALTAINARPARIAYGGENDPQDRDWNKVTA